MMSDQRIVGTMLSHVGDPDTPPLNPFVGLTQPLWDTPVVGPALGLPSEEPRPWGEGGLEKGLEHLLPLPPSTYAHLFLHPWRVYVVGLAMMVEPTRNVAEMLTGKSMRMQHVQKMLKHFQFISNRGPRRQRCFSPPSRDQEAVSQLANGTLTMALTQGSPRRGLHSQCARCAKFLSRGLHRHCFFTPFEAQLHVVVVSMAAAQASPQLHLLIAC